MASQLQQQWQGTDDEARRETYGGGSAHYLATPWPKSELAFAVVIALASVVSIPFVWSGGVAAALVLAAIGLALAAYAAAASLWTFRHPDRAGQHLAAARRFNTVRWRKHPMSVAVLVVVVGFFNGFLRFDDHGLGGRFIAGVAGAAFGALVAGIAVWHSRRVSAR